MLSVIIPAFNEAKSIELCVKAVDSTLSKAHISYEIIIVDDGSSDGTGDVVKKLIANYPITLETFSRNFGKEAAINCGLHKCKGNCAVVFDADLQFPCDTIVEMYGLWKDGYEVIEGAKNERQKESFFKRVGANYFYHLLKKFANIDLKNVTDFKLLDRKVINALLTYEETQLFFRALSNYVGFKKTRVYFDVVERVSGESKWSKRKLIRYALTNITSYTTLPMQIVTYIGLLFMVFSLILGIQTLYNFGSGQAERGFTTVILLLLIIGSVIMLSLGVIGYYLAKIYGEVLRRPIYIVSEEVKGE